MSAPTVPQQEEALFPADPSWVAKQPEPENLTAGERRRRRQQQAMASGLHPLTITPDVRPIRLHPDVRGRQALEASRANAKDRPLRCGTCRWRQPVHGGSRDYPKCVVGHPFYPNGNPNHHGAPRVSHGDNTDCAAWWPACVDYEAEEEAA